MEFEDFYKQYGRTVSCSDDYQETIDENRTFPFEGVYVGDLESYTGYKMPAIISLRETAGFCFLSHSGNRKEINELLQAISLRIIASIPSGLCKFYLYDGTGLGSNLITLSSLSQKIIGDGIITNDAKLSALLNSMEEHIPDVIQKVLGYKYANMSLIDYNEENREKAHPYNFLVITDFPRTLGKLHFNAIERILKYGNKAGVFVILSFDSTYDNNNPYDKDIPYMDVMKHCTTIYEHNGIYHIKNVVNESVFGHFKMSLDKSFLRSSVDKMLDAISVKYEEKSIVSKAPIMDYLPTENTWWQNNSSESANIPFGVSAANKIQYLKITQENGQNSAIVIGIPGSGKSVFLHSLICNAAIAYSPDELNMYLIDFSGVEFNPYAQNPIPHVRVIAPEAEREFGLSIIRELYDEGIRRMELCRQNNVSNIVDLRAKNPSIKMPRMLAIIDEFQKIFEVENDSISKEANVKIHAIIREYRKFGINLVLATQKLPPSSVLPKDLIANRVVFNSSPSDFMSLISLPSSTRMPQLSAGECIYNSLSGQSNDNHKVLGFLVKNSDVEELLKRIVNFAAGRKGEYSGVSEPIVFRADELPEFQSRRIAAAHSVPSSSPDEIGIYLGESIEMSNVDVYVPLRRENGNNILIMGGELQVAQRMAFNSTLSATTSYTDNAAEFRVLNFVRNDEALTAEIIDLFSVLPFDIKVVSKESDVQSVLLAVKEGIETRMKDDGSSACHIFLAIYSFQFARMFDKGERERLSECSQLLDFILRHGPTVGVHTILQCDNMYTLSRIGTPLQYFSYRVALQMSETDSSRVLNSSAANKLYDPKKPSSNFRAYFRDNNRNVEVKFKPYK